MKQEVKKLLILNLPYLLFVYLFDKIGAAIRLTPGADASEKLLQLGTGFAAAFSSIAPSLHPADLLIGVAGAVIIRLAVYMKGKNAKKYRKGIPRVWDTSQQAIFNRRAAAQEGENTEVGTRFLCLLRKFFLNPYYNGKPRFAKLTQKKNAAISKRLQRFLKPI
ncbi:hypothetical protein MUB50_05890 [Blautia sp. NSJ-140]|nr:hypothetical protein [Blautia sp. NSJ-140]MCJ7864192.1 hypothetical protein [Blautia sp. NSJ-140]